MGSPLQLLEPDYNPGLGDDLMTRTLCEYWQSALRYDPKSKGRSDQRFVVQDEK
ncbi:MAG: hypothetical protein Q9196_007410, partial [Gyalolechia fulgens]